MYCVIGSGPSAISAAVALCSRGIHVTIIDAGIGLEEPHAAAKARLGAVEPADWQSEDLAWLQKGMVSTTKGIPKKMVYGSDFAYREECSASTIECHQAKVVRSFAMGGLSNVWGACISPYPRNEISDWPAAAQDLDPHYRAVLGFMPHAGGAGNVKVSALGTEAGRLQMSKQATRLMADLTASREQLAASGITFSQSLLAVAQRDAKGCRYCGKCLYGCPYDLIYKSSSTLQQLISQGLVTYMPGHVVEQLSEHQNSVDVLAREFSTGKSIKFTAKRVFLAAGVLETARIMLESMSAYNTPLVVRHSSRFMLPFLRYAGDRGVTDEQLHTLCQLFMEINDRAVSSESVHLQIYTYNDLFKKALAKKFGCMFGPLEFGIRAFLERLVIIFGYLHSNSSSSFTITLPKSSPRTVRVDGQPNRAALAVAWKVSKKLLLHQRQLRGIPTIPFLDPPGGGNHSGGTFPMRATPKQFESDSLGRPYGFQHLHIVDSSVFPSLPAATITFAAMANAHRIATSCDL